MMGGAGSVNYGSVQTPVVSSQVPPSSRQSSALLGSDALLELELAPDELLLAPDELLLAPLASLGSLGSLGELAELLAEAADPPSEAWAIDIVVKAGTV